MPSISVRDAALKLQANIYQIWQMAQLERDEEPYSTLFIDIRPTAKQEIDGYIEVSHTCTLEGQNAWLISQETSNYTADSLACILEELNAWVLKFVQFCQALENEMIIGSETILVILCKNGIHSGLCSNLASISDKVPVHIKKNLRNLDGGIEQWIRESKPTTYSEREESEKTLHGAQPTLAFPAPKLPREEPAVGPARPEPSPIQYVL